LFWWFCPCKESANINSCDNADVNQHLNDITDLIDSCCDCDKIINESNQVFKADFLIITYQFDSNGGKDLDIKTQIISPLNSLPVGFCDKLNANLSQRNISWSGDNTGYGVESCLIDLKQFQNNANVEILCKAKWWNEKKSGNMSIDIKAYLGGEMKLDRNYQFFNTGGELTAELSFNENVNDLGDFCPIEEIIGTVSYDKLTMKLDFH
tara:strand:+ start:183 stop:809 length:627 start_codon:yes stop_codon:yes gene_type:complete